MERVDREEHIVNLQIDGTKIGRKQCFIYTSRINDRERSLIFMHAQRNDSLVYTWEKGESNFPTLKFFSIQESIASSGGNVHSFSSRRVACGFTRSICTRSSGRTRNLFASSRGFYLFLFLESARVWYTWRRFLSLTCDGLRTKKQNFLPRVRASTLYRWTRLYFLLQSELFRACGA